MTESPYEILGISEDAPMDEVKKAYRKKARENHPDLNPGDPAAAERMNKVNEAYDRIVNPEKYTRRPAGAPHPGSYGQPGGQGAGGGYPGGQNPYDWVEINFDDIFGAGWDQAPQKVHPEESGTDSAEVRQAVRFINSENWAAAMGVLDNIPSGKRNARWHYLFAIANHGAGNIVAALEHIRKARYLEPDNQDFAQAERIFTQRGVEYRQESTRRGFSVGFIDPTSLCCCMLCCGPTFCQPLLLCL